MQYNYTLNPEGIFGAIKYMYTYYPDPNNKSHIREEFINVRMSFIFSTMCNGYVRTITFIFSFIPTTFIEPLKMQLSKLW